MGKADAAARKQTQPAQLVVTYRPLADLIPYARNSRTHSDAQIAQIAASIREFSFTNPVLTDALGGIIAGHGRVLAARQLGLAEVPTITLVGLSEVQKRAYVIADNKLALNAGWDEELLAVELQGLADDGFDFALTGFDQGELDALLKEHAAPDPDVVEDEPPDLPKNPVTKPGDVWQLGRHRLVCGDCRDADTVRLAVGNARVNVALTSPPYASQRKYDESSGFKPIAADDYVQWFEAVQQNVRDVLAPDGSWFVNIKAHCEDGSLHLYVNDLTIAHVRRWGWRYVDELCWTHHGFPGQVVDRFKNAWESIFHFALSYPAKCRPQNVAYESDHVMQYDKDARQSMTGSGWNGAGHEPDRDPGLALPRNVLHLGNGAATSVPGHSATSPVQLPSFFIRAYSDAGDVVLDPFMGSGTTLIAAEQLGRTCHGIELSPAYCDVVVQRWETLTNGKATRA